jgi:hypothetical protein
MGALVESFGLIKHGVSEVKEISSFSSGSRLLCR